MARTKDLTLRIRCCRCGRVDRVEASAAKAFDIADERMERPCEGDGPRGQRCGSRDRRLDVRASA
jgi:hypothetical protein